MKSNKGITLVALVITVVVMLILAGVTISVFTGTDGMFSSITQATREYKKQTMLEAVDLAKLYVELDGTYTDEPITITDVIDKIKEVSTINEKDYIITVDDEEQTATIIDKATGVVVDIWIDENGKVQSDGTIVEDIENIMKPTITYELEPPAGTYGEEVKITIKATEEKNGIVRMVLPDNSEIIYNKEKEVTKEYIVKENGTYTFVVEGANGRKTTKYVEVNNIATGLSIVMEAQNTNPTSQPVNVLIKYDENIKVGGQVLINADRFQYSIGENNWQTATKAETTIQVGVNENIYARYYNGTEGFKTISITIQNIDREKPVISNITASTSWGATKSVTITATDTGTAGCATENIGIVGYGINQSSTTEPSYTPVTATTSLNTIINNISENGVYYVWVKDQAGNTSNKAVTVKGNLKINVEVEDDVISNLAGKTIYLKSKNNEEEVYEYTFKENEKYCIFNNLPIESEYEIIMDKLEDECYDFNNIEDSVYIDKGDVEKTVQCTYNTMYLYKNGNMCEKVTGGYERYPMQWPTSGQGYGSAGVESDGGLVMRQTSGDNFAYGTKNSINISKFNELYIDGILLEVRSSSANSVFQITIDKVGTRNDWNFLKESFIIYHQISNVFNFALNTRKTMAYDLEKIDGNVYASFNLYNECFKVYNIYFKK